MQNFTPSESILYSDYTFETFRVHRGALSAHTAAKEAAEHPGTACNPLFLHGETGSGKTHLLHAIGHTIRKTYPDCVIFYLRAAEYCDRIIEAIASNRTREFTRTMKKADLLLFDNIDQLGGMELTQGELLELFEHLHMNRKQLVFASERPPGALPGFTSRLQSRLCRGQVVHITAPDRQQIPIDYHPDNVWCQVRQELKRHMSAVSYDTWFAGTSGTLKGETLEIRCPNDFTREWISARYREVIAKVLKTLKIPVDSIQFVTARTAIVHQEREGTDRQQEHILREILAEVRTLKHMAAKSGSSGTNTTVNR